MVKEYTEKGAYAQTDMRAKFLASRCPEKGNVRDFLDELRTTREELVQVGVDIEAKNYLSTIIFSLPVSLSSFASATLAAARIFSPTKTIEPDVLLSLLMEEADRMKAQSVRRRVSGKGSDDDKGEALGTEEKSSKPRKGRGRENVKCWNCEVMGHYSHECKEPKKTDEKAKDDATKAQGTSASAVEPDAECEGAWAAELVEDAIEEGPEPALPISKLDWFEEAVAMMDAEQEIVPVEMPVRDCFDEVAESDDESEDEGASSGDDSVDGFDSNASEGTFVEDLGTTSQFWLVCDVFEGADKVLGADLGSCQNEALVTPVVYPEGEFYSGGTTFRESSGRLPGLDADENPWIDATIEWETHAIILRASVGVMTLPVDNPREGGDDTDVQVHENCEVGVIEMLRELDGPRKEFAVCKEYPLVPRFEGEEDIRAETMDLPIACGFPAPIEFLTAEIFDLDGCTSVANTPEGRVKFSESSKTCDDASTTHIVVEIRQIASSHLEPFLDVETYKKGQKVVKGVYGGGGLTLVIGHLFRPPEFVSKCHWMKNIASPSLLIAIVDSCHIF